mgnify:CR=1 FL=1
MNEAVNIPQLRFPEFTKALRRKSLGDFGYFYYGKSAPKWSVTEDAKTPCVRYGELYSTFGEYILDIKSHTNIPPENLKFSKGGEVLVPRVGEDPLDFAYCSFLPISDVAIGEMISVYNTKESGLFFTYYINSKLKKAFARVVEGGNVSNLYYKYLENINVTIPSLDEQDKIIDFLSAVDNKIELLRQKQELLGEYKKGLMQQIFSQAIRFKADDGSDFPDWEEKRLGGCILENQKSQIQVNFVSDNTERDDVNIYPFFTSGNKALFTDSPIVEGDNIFLSTGGIATINFYSGKGSYSTDVFCISSVSENTRFIYYYLLSILIKIDRKLFYGSGLKHLDKKAFRKIITTLPALPEQTKIANFLSSVDSKIEQVGKQLDESKQFKKALLQRMFV